MKYLCGNEQLNSVKIVKLFNKLAICICDVYSFPRLPSKRAAFNPHSLSCDFIRKMVRKIATITGVTCRSNLQIVLNSLVLEHNFNPLKGIFLLRCRSKIKTSWLRLFLFTFSFTFLFLFLTHSRGVLDFWKKRSLFWQITWKYMCFNLPQMSQMTKHCAGLKNFSWQIRLPV